MLASWKRVDSMNESMALERKEKKRRERGEGRGERRNCKKRDVNF